MTAPADAAFAAWHQALATALVSAGVLPSAAGLEAQPETALEPSGDEDALQAAAATFPTVTRAVRALLGGPAARWVLETQVRFEVGAFGGTRSERDAATAAAATAAASAAAGLNAGPVTTLERVVLDGVEPGDLPPNGQTLTVVLRLRFSAADELGRLPL